MQKQVIKAGQTEQYFVVSASVFYMEKEQKYEGMLLIKQRGQEHAKYGASDIRIYSKNKETVYKQLKQIGQLYPPQKDMPILNLEGINV